MIRVSVVLRDPARPAFGPDHPHVEVDLPTVPRFGERIEFDAGHHPDPFDGVNYGVVSVSYLVPPVDGIEAEVVVR